MSCSVELKGTLKAGNKKTASVCGKLEAVLNLGQFAKACALLWILKCNISFFALDFAMALPP